MVEEDSLRGVTSNPAIFEKAILGSPDYDDDLAAAAREGLTAREVYRRLAVRDVQLAADVLRPVYDETGGVRRLRLARGRAAARARHRGHARAGAPVLGPRRPPEPDDQDPGHRRRAIPAIEQALYEGINVNVTLLFAVVAYERVMEAFIRAMERRHAEGKPLDRHSVASFFVSRVDTEVDKRLEALGRTDLAGPRRRSPTRAPPTSAFQRVFEGERFAALREAGCPVQRPLWASTGVKNPPTPRRCTSTGSSAPTPSTRCRCRRCWPRRRPGEVTGATAAEDPAADLDALREAGIDLDDVTDKLLRDGIDAFMVPMAKLLDGIERKREAIVTGAPAAIEADLPTSSSSRRRARARAPPSEDVVRRIWRQRRDAVGAGGHARGRRTGSAG